MKKITSSTIILSLLAMNTFASSSMAQAPAEEVERNTAASSTIQAGAPSEDELSELSKQMNNPLADLWLLFTQNDYTSFQDKEGNDYTMNSLKFQPVMSFDFSENYNLIVRPTFQHMSIEGPGMARENGLGDTGLLAALGPKVAIDGWVLGGGFTSMFPTAEEDALTTMGANQASIGPALVALKITDENTYGAVVQHFSGFGDSNLRDENGNEEDINLTDIQYVYRHKISPTTQIGFAPNIQVDWNKEGSDRFSIPIGIGIDTTTTFGKLPVRMGVEAYHYIEQNDEFGPDFGLRFFIIPVIPSPF
jgi:hypothetical protein